MRRVSRGPCPVNLDGPQSSGFEERLKAIAHFTNVVPSQTKFAFMQYKADPVKRQLSTDYRQKCAYCESNVSHVTHADIDHFRPKSAYRDVSGEDVKPGYFWLASDWENLFLSCHLCNRPTWQALATGGRSKVGKGTHFPLLDESKRATGPGTETTEDPLLLNPDHADVETHLEFLEDGVVVPAILNLSESIKGQRSIDVYGLQRVELVRSRGDHLRGVKATIVRYKRERQAYFASPTDSGVRERLMEAMQEIREYLCCRKQYLSMTRQHITRECRELVPLPACTASSCLDPRP